MWHLLLTFIHGRCVMCMHVCVKGGRYWERERTLNDVRTLVDIRGQFATLTVLHIYIYFLLRKKKKNAASDGLQSDKQIDILSPRLSISIGCIRTHHLHINEFFNTRRRLKFRCPSLKSLTKNYWSVGGRIYDRLVCISLLTSILITNALISIFFFFLF